MFPSNDKKQNMMFFLENCWDLTPRDMVLKENNQLWTWLCGPQVSWMKNSKELRMGKKYEASSLGCKRTLTIHNVTHEDAGVYECVCDGDKMSIQLAIKGKLLSFKWILV